MQATERDAGPQNLEPTALSGCDGLTRAIANCYVDRANSSLVPVFNALALALKADAKILLPFVPESAEPAVQAHALEDTFITGQGAAIRLRRLTDRDGNYWTPLFTDEAEVTKGPAAAVSPQPLRALFEAVLSWKHCQGVQINPWGSVLMMDKASIRRALSYRAASHISLVAGDITKMHTDAIVNAANETLLGGGGVDGAIHRAAGPALKEACRKLHGCKTGEAKATKGFSLAAQYVLHTVGPIYTGTRRNAAELARCYGACLTLAKENGCRSVAFPCISTGAYGYPAEEAARISMAAVVSWLDENPDTVLDIYFCCYDEPSLAAYKALIAAGQPAPQDVQDLEAGERAYQAKEFEKAIRLYTASAEAGNVTAMSNLGYCYYYGRDIPVDKEKASYWWQKACELGDACATYKLGDMYRRGELPKDEKRARALYRRAFALAATDKNINSYPDACLRIFKFDAEGRTQKELFTLLHAARIGFEARIKAGDVFTDKLLAEALNLEQAFHITAEL